MATEQELIDKGLLAPQPSVLVSGGVAQPEKTQEEIIAEEQGIDTSEAIGLDFAVNNALGSFLQRQQLKSDFFETSKVIDKETDFLQKAIDEVPGLTEDELEVFFDVENIQQFRLAERFIGAERDARQQLTRTDLSQDIITGLITGGIDPLAIVGGGGTAIALGKRASTAIGFGTIGAASSIAPELSLLQTSSQRTVDESIVNVLASSVMGTGLFGVGKVAQKAFSKNSITVRDSLDKDPEADITEYEHSIGAAETPLTDLTDTIDDLSLSHKNDKLQKALEKTGGLGATAFSPAMRMMNSPSSTIRKATDSLISTNLRLNKHKKGNTSGPAAEDLAAAIQSEADVFMQNTESIYRKYKQDAKQSGNDFLTKDEFYRELTKANSRGNNEANPFINQGGNELRKFYDRSQKFLVKHGDLVEGVTPENNVNYVAQWWRNDIIKGDIDTFRTKMTEHWIYPNLQKEIDDLKLTAAKTKRDGTPTEQALKAQERLDGEFAEENIQDLIDDALKNLEDKLLGLDPKNVVGPLQVGGKSFLKERTVLVQRDLLDDFMENDSRELVNRFSRNVAPKIALKEKFGTDNFQSYASKLGDEFNQELRARKLSKKEELALRERYKKDLATIEAMWRILDGSYRSSGIDPDSKIGKALYALRSLNTMRLLGGVLISSLGDTFIQAIRGNMGEIFKIAASKHLKTPEGVRLSRQEARNLRLSLEAIRSGRMMDNLMIGDPYATGSNFNRMMNSGINAFFRGTGISYWNDIQQEVAAMAVQNRLMKTARKVADGKKLTKAEAEEAAFLGLNRTNLREIAKLQKQHGFEEAGHTFSGINNWGNSELQNAYRAAIGKHVRSTVIQRGIGDMPLYANTVEGKTLFQFMGFAMAAHTKLLVSGIQQADQKALIGMMGMVGMGYFIEYLKAVEAGRELDDFDTLTVNAIDRSGVVSMLMYANNLMDSAGIGARAALNGGNPGYPTGGDQFVKSLLGPMAGTVSTATQLSSNTIKSLFTDKRFTKKDLNRLRQLLPFQNVILLRHILDQIESGVADSFGLPDNNKRQRQVNTAF